MYFTVLYEGREYRSKSTNECSSDEFLEAFYSHLEDLNKFQITLEDGSIIFFGKGVIQKSVFCVVPEEGDKK